MSLCVLVSGASGFVGSALLRRLADLPDYHALAGVRRSPLAGVDCRVLGELDGRPLDPALLAGVDVVVHCAARVHVMQETTADPLAAFRAVNVHGSLALAQAAAQAGVRRFIYLSSLKAHGEETLPGTPLRADSPLQPEDAYGRSKAEAEQALRVLCARTGLQLVIIRPPLVYGPGVKGNLRSLLRVLQLGVPLPLGGIDNRRSLVALDNLVDLIMTCLQHPAAAGQALLVSDGDDLSTTRLLRLLARGLGRSAHLLPLPSAWLVAAAHLLGRAGVARRLCGWLQVDSTPTCQLLGWTPPQSVEEAMQAMARDYLQQRTRALPPEEVR